MKGLHYVRISRRDRIPGWYVYAWRGGPLIIKCRTPKKPIFNYRQTKFISSELEKIKFSDPDTLGSLIRDWKSFDPQRPPSAAWSALPPGTKRSWGFTLEFIDKKWGKLPIESFDGQDMGCDLALWYQSGKEPASRRNSILRVLSALIEFGRSKGRLRVNIANQISPLDGKCPPAPVIWTSSDVSRFIDAALARNRLDVLDGMRLAALTGLRRAELVQLSWDEIAEGEEFTFATWRKGMTSHVTIPRVPALVRHLEELRDRDREAGVSTVLVTSQGKPWRSAEFGRAFNSIRNAADIRIDHPSTHPSKHKHLRDIRTTFCATLQIETALSDGAIAHIMGWSPARVRSIRLTESSDAVNPGTAACGIS